MSIGQNIAIYRINKRIFQKDLALAVGVSATYLCQIERDTKGRYVPSAGLIEKIAKELGVKIEELTKE
ncbi:MAG: helix-turn-helix transcriptional regulator [Candidatus Micrarchaeia archaeon]|jgi:transcriptional regulator with XRE-family HTH domain